MTTAARAGLLQRANVLSEPSGVGALLEVQAAAKGSPRGAAHPRLLLGHARGHEQRVGVADDVWPDCYAECMTRRQTG